MTKIVMVSAKQGGGKSALANELLRTFRTAQFDFGGTYKFAKTIYELQDLLLNRMERLTGVPRVEKDGDLLQLLGTNWGRKKFGENVWADILKKEILAPTVYTASNRLSVVDDLRFKNEFNVLPEAYRVRLECPEDVRRRRATSWREDVNHPSEIDLDEYAAEGRFDLTVCTDPADPLYVPVEGIASLIYAALQKDVDRWNRINYGNV